MSGPFNGLIFQNVATGPSGTNGAAGATGPAGANGGTFTPVAPTIQKFIATGATAGALFQITTGASAALNAVYGNNGSTYLVNAAFNGVTFLFTGGAGMGAALSGATLRLMSGTGSSGIGFTNALTMATYTAPTPAPLYLRVEQVGGGGGGGGGGTTNSTAGGNGGPTVFGNNVLICVGGGGGTNGNVTQASSLGGPVTVTGFTGINTAGMGGEGTPSNASTNQAGGSGGNTPFGGAGAAPGGAGASGQVGNSAATNSGSGASGGSAGNGSTGGGGAAGGYINLIIKNPAATYPYVVGAAGTLGAAGTSGSNGGTGGAGQIIVEEYYQ